MTQYKTEVRCNHISVGRWLAGGGIKPQTARMLAELVSVELHETVTPAALGFDIPDSDLAVDALRYTTGLDETLLALDGVLHRDLSDSLELQKAAAAQQAWAKPLITWLVSRPTPLPVNENGRHVGISDVTAICSTIRLFMDLDFQFGGGHARSALAQYVRHDVLPLLKGRYTEETGKKLFSAAAQAIELLGWTAYDLGRHATAQRYMIKGLSLAQTGQDRVMGGRLLASMSHQANYLGYAQEAAELARGAQEGAKGVCTPVVASMFLSMEARALATARDEKACTVVLREAEKTFAKPPAEEPKWIYYFDAAELAGEAAHCWRDLRIPTLAKESVTHSIDATGPEYVRTQGFIRLVHAASYLHGRYPNPEEAASVGQETIGLVGPIKSERLRRYIRDLRNDLLPYKSSPVVQEALRVFQECLASEL